ncbi:hypothetical protein CPC08DRAFT_704284 [Agrocybe pediades]|nr:hypothetical protein CPC08DRAFT_704284 [Agrocybe pediades]
MRRSISDKPLKETSPSESQDDVSSASRVDGVEVIDMGQKQRTTSSVPTEEMAACSLIDNPEGLSKSPNEGILPTPVSNIKNVNPSRSKRRSAAKKPKNPSTKDAQAPPKSYLKYLPPSQRGAILPPDVLNHIHEIVHYSQGGRIKLPISVTLSHVCGLWRQLALDNPRLWDHIQVHSPWKVDPVQAFLERSKQMPLDVQLFLDYNDLNLSTSRPDYYKTRFRTLGRLLSGQSSRIRKLDIRSDFRILPFRDLLHEVLQDFSDKEMHILEEFIVYAYNDYGRRASSQRLSRSDRPITPFRATPKLKIVGLGRLAAISCLPNFSTATRLHLSGLDSYSSGRVPPPLDDILKSCSCVEHISIAHDWSWNMDPSHVCEIPTLRSCYVFGHASDSIPSLLIRMRAPNLQELVLPPAWDKDIETAVIHDPHIKIPVSFPKLQSLTIQDRLTGESLASIAKIFPQITVLVVSKVQASAEVPKNIFTLLPNLCTLSLIRPSSDIIGHLSRMLSGKSKKNHIYHFDTLLLDKKTLKEWTEDGLMKGQKLFCIKEGDIWERQLQEYILD